MALAKNLSALYYSVRAERVDMLVSFLILEEVLSVFLHIDI
jgi:hypothetical protein